MPLEYKPNFTSASGGGGFVSGYHGTPDSFTQQETPDFAGAMKTLAGVVEDYKDDAFEQGKLDQIAGEIDNNKILFKDAYLAGAEYATSFQKMAEFQAYVADESNKALGRGESAEEFYARISPKIAEYRDSYVKIKQVNPEAGSLLTNNLMNVAKGALQNYGVARLERAYEYRRAGSVTTATAGIVGPLQKPDVNSEVMQGAILQTIPALKADAKSMGLNEEEYVSTVLIDSFKNTVTGLNFNEPNHQAWVNIMQSTVRDLVDGGVIDRAKSTALLTLLQGKVKEASLASVNQILLQSDELARNGTYSSEQRDMHRAQILSAEKHGVDLGHIRSSLATIDKNWANSNKDANVLHSIPTDTNSQNRQATAFVKQHQGESPATLIQNAVGAIQVTKNSAIADKTFPLLAESFVSSMSRDPKEGQFTTRELENMYALAYSYDNTSGVVDRNSVYKNSDVRDFLLSRENRALMYSAANGDTKAVTTLREKWANFMTEGKKVMTKTQLTDDDTYTWFWSPFSKEIQVKHGDVELAVMNQMAGSVERYSKNIITNKDQYIGRLEQLKFEGKSGLVIMSPMDYNEVLPALWNTGGVNHHDILDDALVSVIKAQNPDTQWKPDDLVVRYSPESQQWLFYDGTQDTEAGVAQLSYQVDQYLVDQAIAHSIRKQHISDQENSSRAIVTLAYSSFDEKAKAPSLTVVRMPVGRVGVVNVDGFTMGAMLQGLSAAVDGSTASADLKNSARAEIELARGLGTHFKDDSSLRKAVEACTGMDFDSLVGSILSADKEPVELSSDYDTPYIGESAKIVARQSAIDTVAQYYENQIKERAGLDENSETSEVQYTTLKGDTVRAEELGKVTEFILNNTRGDTNPWGEKNILNNEDAQQELKETLLNIGRVSDARLQAIVQRTTGRSFDDWVEASRKEPRAVKEDHNKAKITMSKDWFDQIKSLRKPMTVYGTWNKTIFGDLGAEFATELEKDEGFLVDWINTRSPDNQKNPDLKQVDVIGLGFVKDGYPAWQPKFDAARGDAEKLSQVTADFAVWYYKDIPTKLDAYGFSLQEMQTNPDLKPALFALGSFLWHQGRGSNAYLEAMKVAKTDLNKAYALVKSTSAYKQAGASRQRRYLEGIKAVALANINV